MEYYDENEGTFWEKPAGFCDVCLCQVYDGDEVYLIDGFIICTDCFDGYVRDIYAGCRTLGENLNWRKRRYDT